MQCVAKSVKTCVSKKKRCVLWLVKYLEEVEEEEDYILERLHKRKPIGAMYLCREKEGVYRNLVENHLLDDQLKYKHISDSQGSSLISFLLLWKIK
jgi:hypothetical protein